MIQQGLMERIIKNFGIIFFGNSMASVLNIVSFAMMARAVGPELLAIFVLAQTYALIINDIFNIQTWETMIKFGSAKFMKEGFPHIVKTNLALDAISALLAFIFALILIRPVSFLLHWDISNLQVFSLYTFSILFNITSMTIGVPRLFNKFSSIAKIQVSVAFLRIICISLLFVSKSNLFNFVFVYLILDVLTNVILILYSFLLLNEKIGKGWWKSKLNIDREQLRFIWWTNLRTIIRIPVRHFDVLVIGSVVSLPMLGFYKVYKEITGVINRVSDPVNQVIFPEFTKLIGAGDSGQSVRIAKRTMLLMSFIGLGLTVVLLFSSNFIVNLAFGQEYLAHIEILYIMIIIAGLSFSLVPIDSLFIAAGFAKVSFFVLTFTNTVYVAAAFFGGSFWGLYGVVIANALQKFLNKTFKVYFMMKYPSGWKDASR